MSQVFAFPGGDALLFDESARMSAPAAFGTYRVFHQMGSGVQGPVFRAFDLRQDRLVAVKAFTFDVPPERVVRLADALRDLAAAPAVTPAIVSVVDAGIEGLMPFIVMECLTGETLDVALRRLAPMPAEDAVAMLARLAAAIDTAAATGLRHGALHPRDIFVTPGSEVRVTGFGITQALQRADLPVPVRRPYSAPDRGARPDACADGRADLYALAVIAHEMLTGARPSGSGEQNGAFAAATSPEERVQLRRVLGIALAEQADDRYASGAAFADALVGAVRRDRPVSPVVNDAVPVVVERAAPIPILTAVTEVESAPVRLPVPESVPPEVVPIDAQPEPVFAPTARAGEPTRPGRPADVVAHVDVMRRHGLATHVPVTAQHGSGSHRLSMWRIGVAAVLALACGGAILYMMDVRRVRVARAEVAATPPATSSGSDIFLPALPVESATDTTVDVAPPHASALAAPDARVDVAPVGRLHIRSQPTRALVTVDGRLSGETPTTVRDLPPGTYTVRVARPGHVPREERVTLAAASPVRTLMFALEPGLSSVVPALGALDVDSRPRGAHVRVDGRLFGAAPLRVPALRPGPHEIVLDLDGYTPATRQVNIAAGLPSALKVTLQSLVP